MGNRGAPLRTSRQSNRNPPTLAPIARDKHRRQLARSLHINASSPRPLPYEHEQSRGQYLSRPQFSGSVFSNPRRVVSSELQLRRLASCEVQLQQPAS
jgi:hypothetical protein